MGSQEPPAPEGALDVFTREEDPQTPLTTSEVAEALGCARRTAYSKLESLADRGEIETKKVGARGRVWWRPVDRTAATRDGASPSFEGAQFEELIDAVRDYAIFVLDPEGYVRTWNEGARQIKGYREDEIVGEHFSTFYTEPDREADVPARNLERAREAGRTEDEGERLRADGSTFWANVTITAIRDDDGEVEGFVKVTRDMTERHEFEQRLRREKDRFETLVREVKDYAIFLLDPDGYVQTWNDGARRIKGYREEDIVGEHFSTFYTAEDRSDDVPAHNLRAAAHRGRIEDEGQRLREDGSTFWANVIITALHDDSGDIRGYAKVTRDMTDRHEYEQRLREQRDELDELDRINTVIRDIDQTLVTATTRDEIEREVCERLADSEAYAAAWIGEYSEGYADIAPRSWAGISDDYLAAIREGDGTETAEAGVGATALRTRTIQPVHELGASGAGEPWRNATIAEGYESAITVPLVYNDVEYGVLTVYSDEESAFSDRKIAVLNELGETISHAIAAIRRKQRERTLTALQESTRELFHTDSREGIGGVIVETLTEDLVLSEAVVYSFDTEENVLEPVSWSFRDARATEPSVLSAGTDSPVWTGFVEDESRFATEPLPATGIGQQTVLVLPLGDHGVLCAGVADGEGFDAKTRSLVELVAATAEAAFDRRESQANLQERDELLQEQNQRLQRLNGINTIIREVDQGLVQAATREEVQRTVCERLTGNDRFRFAWIGTRDDAEQRLTPRARSGNGRGFLDGLDLSVDDAAADPLPAIAAAQSGDVAVISNVAENLRGGQWRKEAFSREFQSMISVPLAYGDVSLGVLSVYANRPDEFEEMEQTVFAELGHTIANAIDGVETKRSLLADTAIELEFRLGEESSSLLGQLALGIDADVTYEGVVPLTESSARLFFTVHGGSPETLRDLLQRSVTVESFELLDTGEEGHFVEAVTTGSTIVLTLVKRGASIRRFTASADDVRLVVDLPSGTDVREFIERIQSTYGDVEFLARRERERPVRTRDGLYAELEEQLTPRQLEVLKTAYYSGYFGSPRTSTGGDVAELLDVSQPTVTEQLRTAQRRVLELLLEDDPAGG